MGIFPIWGFQMIVAIAVSIFYKLNKALVLIGANISILPLMPFILYLSHLTGSVWLGKEAVYITLSRDLTLDFMWNSALQYFLGAATLAVIAGLLFGLVTYLLLKIFKKK